MTKPLRLLLVEDSERDAAHVMLSLRREGWVPEVRRVETGEEMVSALREGTWDAIVSDYHLPRFSAPDALQLLRDTGLDIPFIVVSGAIGEDTAVRLMRLGATDYLLKDRMKRLTAAIEREMNQAEQRRAKRRAESLFQAVLRASPHPSAIVDCATMQVIDGSNSFARAFLGDTRFPTTKTITDLIDFSLPDRIEQLLARGSGAALHTVYYAGGTGHVANVRCYSVEHEGARYQFVVLEDITEQHYLKAAFDAIGDAVLVIGSDGKLLYANRGAEALFGSSLYFGMDVEPLLSRTSMPERWWLRRTSSRFEQHRFVVNDQPHSATSVVFRFAGEPSESTILTLHNIAEEEELERLATHDALTGAYNLRYFESIVPEHVATGGALALIDHDYFKPINDELGHAAGDAALITFANVIRDELRGIDVFARLGGDEFAVVFPRSTLDDVQTTMNRVYARLERTPLRFDGKGRLLSASCGITSIAPEDTAASLKERADRALYDAKHQGRGRFVVAN